MSDRSRGRAVAPANDNFANFTVVAGALPYVDNIASTLDATAESFEPLNPICVGVNMGRTVWYRLAVTADVVVDIDTAGSSYDTVLAVYTGGSLPSLSEAACTRSRRQDVGDRRVSQPAVDVEESSLCGFAPRLGDAPGWAQRSLNSFGGSSRTPVSTSFSISDSASPRTREAISRVCSPSMGAGSTTTSGKSSPRKSGPSSVTAS